MVRAALIAYDPFKPVWINAEKRSGMSAEAQRRRATGPKPPCPQCGSNRLRAMGWNKARTAPRWMCYGCGQTFTQETKEAIAC